MPVDNFAPDAAAPLAPALERLLREAAAENTRLHTVNASLRVSAERLSVTLNSIGDGVIATDAAGTVTCLNPVAARLTGWSEVAAMGLPVDQVFHILNKQTRALATIPVLATLAQGTTQGLTNHTVLISRDGVERDIADSCAPIRDIDGAVVGAVLVFRDVTREYEAAEAAREAAALQNAIFNSANFSCIATDARGVIQIFNVGAERMLGYAAGDVMDRITPAEISDPAELLARAASLSLELATPISPGFEALVFKASRGIEDIYELTYIRKDGSRFPAVVSVTALRDAQEGIIGYLLIGTDNTARKQVEEERRRIEHALQETNAELEAARIIADKANHAKSDFLSSMSHELRSPLNAILGFAQLMDSDSPPATPAQKASIEQILRAGWYLLELINEILDLAVVESGRLSMSLEPVSLQEVLHECETMMTPQGASRGLSLMFPAPGRAQFVVADRTRLKQVLINLVSNAIKYNRPGGTVVVDLLPLSPDRIRIRVRDTGQGLSRDAQSQLFQPFNRLGQEGGTEVGTGIGLVMSKLLVELMGGIIGVESKEGVGSVFWFELGRVPAPAGLVDTVELVDIAAESAAEVTPARTILYVEDNAANLQLVRQLLARRPQLRLLSATSGDLGVELARLHLPDLILMDINLPGLSGLQALKILQLDPSTSHIPVLAVSANAMEGDVRRGLAAGFFGYITKPINVSRFMEALDAGLAFAAETALPARSRRDAS